MHDSVPQLSKRLQPFIAKGYDTILVEAVDDVESTEIKFTCLTGNGPQINVLVPDDVVQDVVNFFEVQRSLFEHFGGPISQMGLGVSRNGKSTAWVISDGS